MKNINITFIVIWAKKLTKFGFLVLSGSLKPQICGQEGKYFSKITNFGNYCYILSIWIQHVHKY